MSTMTAKPKCAPGKGVSRRYYLGRRKRRGILLLLLLPLIYLFFILPLTLHYSHQRKLNDYDKSISQLPMPRVFIAAMVAHSAPLLSAYWIPAVLDLVEKLGPQNVHVSILENESLDDSRTLLKDFQTQLQSKGIPNTFQFEEGFRDGYTMETDTFLPRILGEKGNDNWMLTDQGWMPRRIAYLAELRNMVMEPLRTLTRRFDKVLFLNDVIFEV